MLDNVRGKDIPIVHRVVRTFPEVEGRVNAKKVKEITVYGFSFLGYTLANSGLRDTTPDTHMLLTKVCFTRHWDSGSLTNFSKGDNNLSDDTDLYARDQDHLDRKEDIEKQGRFR